MKLVTLAVFGAGYVLGTKAGRERYDQLRTAARLAARRLEEYGDRGRSTSGSTSTGAARQA